jgi:hypothetical protein
MTQSRQRSRAGLRNAMTGADALRQAKRVSEAETASKPSVNFGRVRAVVPDRKLACEKPLAQSSINLADKSKQLARHL